ncbi:MAG: hypothetical protein JXO49_10675 [Deltaproteobacteria bacterium]|nr:hypothetical protein [Candidatus Anaeroferrophillus wilburensis]MBN2889796.1 hypothetical protein [Deltaproteobacteria bacterium]
MKNTFRIITLFAILHANSVFAASGAGGGGIGLIGWIFIGFLAVIITFQFVPAAFMFVSMMAAIFGKARNRERVTDNAKVNNS